METKILTRKIPSQSRGPWLRRRLARAVWNAASVGDPIASRWYGILAATILAGVVPVVMAFAWGSTFHQPVTALLLAPLVWSCARRDDWRRGMAALALTFAWHSAAVIAAAYGSPARAVSAIPDGPAYWDKQWTWITTGNDPEYELAAWAFAHIQLLTGTTILSFTSLGVITLHQGLYEVDLMNFYNSQLLHQSRDGWWSMLLGWHVWSVLRGLGYVVLTFEMISLALQVFTGQNISTPAQRKLRWAIAGICLIGDATTKYLLLDAVRVRLYHNLLGN